MGDLKVANVVHRQLQLDVACKRAMLMSIQTVAIRSPGCAGRMQGLETLRAYQNGLCSPPLPGRMSGTLPSS